ncbi:AbrB/MazE/SpoVT family DNA-binding domain-containing protein [Sulfuriferula sp.]|uniref:AbrB/MazE/SpoVT family DNA-binding domain-containing protein n=1 Tax=Sulfuriferula sp. TaxID=2025307 RepID=UPI0027322445|nr:AbrB/MazE/SpoVT family DNA-binding domain-containing protein [Sulfuriferula sp.]MDP1620315.1 AbrB/MazE/SpoVT family DNA-binding domain-containing protein [bacterium]MDP2024986.1 AbrB/MazE/SpoVT family DNA-binding domain-containing protein [Sulfuriferula sp.]
MSTVRVRPKHQITLPVSIVNQAGIHQDDLLEASYANGVIMLVPKARQARKGDIMDYAGIAYTVYGKTADDIDAGIAQLRDEWER